MTEEPGIKLVRMHWPSLAVALAVMLVGTIYPPMFSDASRHVDHAFAVAMFCAMSVGFVRGVGFVPRAPIWRFLFSGWACGLFVAIALVIKAVH